MKVVLAAALVLQGAAAVAQTMSDRLPRLRRPGERPSEVTAARVTDDDVQIENATRGALGERADTAGLTSVQSNNLNASRRINNRLSTRLNTRLPTRIEATQTGDTTDSDGTRGNADRPRP